MGKLITVLRSVFSLAAPVLVLAGACRSAVPSAAELPGRRATNRPACTQAARISQQTVDRVADALAGRIDYYWHRGDYDSIAFLCSQIVELDPSDVGTWANYGWILWAGLDNDDEALKVLKRGLQLNPKRYELYFEIGQFLYHKRQYAEAERYLAQATKLSAPPIVWNLYAHAVEKSGSPDRAEAIWRDMQKRFPTFELSAVNLERLKRVRARESAAQSAEQRH
ncbi:MAG: tetratricopeptide repeat protein [Armatimonadota bacterium]